MTPTYNHADHPRQLVVAITGASGVAYATLVDRLLTLAIDRHRDRQDVKTSLI